MCPTESKTAAIREDRHATSWAAAALLVTLWIGIPWLASAAAAIPLVLGRRTRHEPPRASLVWRWAAMVFLMGTVMSGLAAERATRAIPSGAWARDAATTWLNGSGDAFPSALAVLVIVTVFAGATLATRGLAGTIVLAEVLLGGAVYASVVYAHAYNLFPATAVAVAPWTIALIVGMSAALSPLGRWGARFFGRTPSLASDPHAHRALIAGAGLVALSIALRLATGPAITRLARQLTLP